MKTTKKRISVTVNGESYEREVVPAKSLLDFLRTDLNLTGTKEGCGEGECGACAVIMDGRLVDSCLILAVEAGPEYPNRRRSQPERPASPFAENLRRKGRRSVRLLHAGNDHGGKKSFGPQSRADLRTGA